MNSLYDLGIEVMKIREDINSIEVKGGANASLIVSATNRCNSIIEAINALVKRVKSDEEGDSDGKQPD